MTHLDHDLRHALLLPLMGALLLGAAPIGARGDEPAQTAWELSPYRIHVLIAAEADASLPLGIERDLVADLPARAAATHGGYWRLEASSAPNELRYRILQEISEIQAEEISAAAKKGDKAILLGIGKSDGGYRVRARELDVVTGLWNSVFVRDVRQAASVKREAFWGVLTAFAPVARIEKVEDQIVTLRLRGAALARRDGSLPLLVPGTVFRPALVKSEVHGVVKPGEAEKIAWTFLSPTDPKITAAGFTCRIQTGLSGKVIPDYHPTRQRWAVAVSPSKESTRLRFVEQGTAAASLEGYEVAAQSEDSAGKQKGFQTLGRSGRDGSVLIPPGPQTVRLLVVRHGEEVLARLPVVPGLTAEIMFPLADDRPRLAIETALARIQDDLVDLIARREVLASRIRAAVKGGDTGAADKLKEQLQRLPSLDPLLSELGQQQQALDLLEGQSRQKMQKKLAEIRTLAEKLKAENPADKLKP